MDLYDTSLVIGRKTRKTTRNLKQTALRTERWGYTWGIFRHNWQQSRTDQMKGIQKEYLKWHFDFWLRQINDGHPINQTMECWERRSRLRKRWLSSVIELVNLKSRQMPSKEMEYRNRPYWFRFILLLIHISQAIKTLSGLLTTEKLTDLKVWIFSLTL